MFCILSLFYTNNLCSQAIQLNLKDHETLQKGISKAAKNHFKSRNEISNTSETYFLNRLDGYINFIAQVRGDDDALVMKFRYHYKMIFQLV